MKWTLRIALLALLLGLGAWLWFYLHPSPQEAIRRQLNGLAEAASFEAGEGLIGRASASQRVAGYFATEVTMNIEISRVEIAEQALYLRMQKGIRSFKVKILDPVITMGADNKSAIVEVTLHAETEGEKHLIVQEMKFMMRAVEDDWLILRMETVRTLNRAPVLRPIELFPAT
jgi:hypothetical protein